MAVASFVRSPVALLALVGFTVGSVVAILSGGTTTTLALSQTRPTAPFSVPLKVAGGRYAPHAGSRTSTQRLARPALQTESAATDPSALSSGSSFTTFAAIGILVGLAVGFGAPLPSAAFENAIPEAAAYSNERKSPGDQPKDLGLRPRKELSNAVGLKACDGAPHCFSTSGPDDKHRVAAWVPPAGTSPTDALAQLKDVVAAYPPGQQEIDGGGFKVITSEPDYLYVQFESLKSGFIDDVEFAANPEGPGILLRSSSRQGYLDILVNAKRLNWIAEQLEQRGWVAPQLTRANHLDYFKLNNLEFFPFQR
jgi:uncharacterized protein (DUF1499 family)